MTPIPFFSDEITLDVHSATERAHVGQHVSVQEFAAGEPVALYDLGNGELKAFRGWHQSQPRPFIEGKEVQP